MAFGQAAHDILIRVLGDEEDAREALSDLATQLAVFSKAQAEAEADVNTELATEKLRELRLQLERIDKSEADVAVQAHIEQAMIELQILEHEVREMDRIDADIDVDIDRDVIGRINTVSNSILRLTSRINKVSEDTETWLDAFRNVSLRMGPFTTSLARGAAVIFAVLLPAIVAVAGAIGALASSAIFAVGGLGALAIAAGSLLAPAIGLVVAAVQRFKDQSDIAGTASNNLKKAFDGIGDAAKKLLPAADPVLQALADGINEIKGSVGLLAPLFRQFGRAAGDALTSLLDTLTSPEIAGGFAQILGVGSRALRPLADIAGSLARVFTNIAVAAMPLLVEGLESVADLMENLADSSATDEFAEGIQTLVGHFESWVELGGEVARVIGGFLKAAAPAGKTLVDKLTEGAQAMADWIESAEGQETIKTFFDDVLPVAEELAEALTQVLIFFTQLGQIAGPSLETLLTAFNDIMGVVNFLLEAFIDLVHFEPPDWGEMFGDVKEWAGTALQDIKAFSDQAKSAMRDAFGDVGTFIGEQFAKIPGLISSAFSTLGNLRGTVRGAIGSAFSGIGELIGGAFRGAVGIVRSALSRIPGIAKDIMGRVIAAFRPRIPPIVVNIARGVINVASQIFGIVRGIFRRAIQMVPTISRAVVGIAQGIWSNVRGIMRRGIEIAVRMASGIVEAASDLFNTIKDIFSETISIHVDFPDPPGWLADKLMAGTRNFEGGLAMVGESGPELTYIPQGADVYTANQTKRILRALAGGSKALLPRQMTEAMMLTPVLAPPRPEPGAGGTVIYNFDVTAPPGTAPDVDTFLAQTGSKVRSLGGAVA